jgi:hypothetical protein
MGASLEKADGIGHSVELVNSVPVVGGSTATQSPKAIDTVSRVFDLMINYVPYKDMHPIALRFTSFLTSPPKDSKITTISNEIVKEIVDKINQKFKSQGDLLALGETEKIAADLAAVAASQDDTDKRVVNSFALTVAAKDERVKLEEDITKLKEGKEQLEKQKQAEAIQKQLEQQAVQQALQQAAQGQGGKGGSGSGNSNNSQPPKIPDFNSKVESNHDLASQLDKVLNQKNNTPDLSSLFNNNNNNAFGSGNNKEKKDEKEGFKFDISPKTPKNEIKPVKAETPSDNSAANSPLDPSDPKSLSGNPDDFLNGPTSVPQLAQANPVNPALVGGDGGGGASNGLSGGVKGGASGFDNSGAQEIFQGVGRLDYGQLPPPIRKASADLGGEYSGASEEGYTYSNNNGLSKKEPLVNELVFIKDESRRKGKGLMAFVGYQVKDICSKPGASTSQIFCKIKRRIKKEETISLNK